MREQREMQFFAALIHGLLAAGHGLGLVYNIRKKNWMDVAVHSVASTYDLWAMQKHLARAKEAEDG